MLRLAEIQAETVIAAAILLDGDYPGGMKCVHYSGEAAASTAFKVCRGINDERGSLRVRWIKISEEEAAVYLCGPSWLPCDACKGAFKR